MSSSKIPVGIKTTGEWLKDEVEEMEKVLVWLESRLEQLHYEWTRTPTLPPNVTIPRLRRILREANLEISASIERATCSADLVSIIRKARFVKSQSLPISESIIGLYNERLEGSHFGAVTEPITRLGERTGLLELIFTALDRLMIDYCGLMKKDHPLFLDEPEKTKGWAGLVTSNTGRDYEIRPAFQVLSVPLDLKLSAHNLLLLAHEAAHFTLYNLRTSQSSTLERLERLFLPSMQAAFRTEAFVALLAANKVKVKEIAFEILTDILAYLIGGPTYGLAFESSHIYDSTARGIEKPPTSHGIDIPHLNNIFGKAPLVSPRIRVRCGLLMAKQLGWAKPWVDLLSNAEKRMTAVEQQQKNVLKRASEDSDYRLYLLVQRITEAAMENLFHVTPSILKAAESAIMLAFDPDASPLFFSGAYKDTDGCYQHVSSIADRLFYGQEIVSDARPRDLVAASGLALAGRGFNRWVNYPTFRVYLSMIYCAQFKAEQQTLL